MRTRRITGLAIVVLLVAGMVVVWLYAGSNPVLPGLGGCGWVRSADARIECLSTRIQQSVSDRGVEATARSVDELVQAGAVGAECHVAWHPTGERRGRAAARDGNAIPTLESASWCTQGYDHGFLIGYLDSDGADVTSLSMSSTCHAVASEGTINCVHAFGHAFARADDDLDTSWHQCQVASDSPLVRDAERTAIDLRRECMSGATMELALTDRASGIDRVRSDDCAGASGDARSFCIEYLPTRAGLVGDERPIAEICNAVTDDREERARCVAAA